MLATLWCMQTEKTSPSLAAVEWDAWNSSWRVLNTAHFANVDMPAPCFSQEFAPTSVAFAEVQSMFLDSILNDPDWQTRYATTKQGEPMPFS